LRHILLRLVPMAFACIASQGQQQELRFEVASIKPGTPLNRVGRPRGGPGTTDPGMFTCTSCDLALLISMAYGPLSSGQFQASNYLNSLRSTFYIVAKVPPGATRQEFQMMMRNLLVERFKVAAHRELRVMPVYELTATKDGPKFNPAKPAEPNNDELPDVESVEMPKRASDGSWIFPPGIEFAAVMAAGMGHARIQLIGKPMSELTRILSNQFRMPIVDKTGLTDTYNISVSWQWESQDRADRDAGLQEAIRSQLGLQLRPNKGQVPVLVLDHVETVPVEN